MNITDFIGSEYGDDGIPLQMTRVPGGFEVVGSDFQEFYPIEAYKEELTVNQVLFAERDNLPAEFEAFSMEHLGRIIWRDGGEMEDFNIYPRDLVLKALAYFAPIPIYP